MSATCLPSEDSPLGNTNKTTYTHFSICYWQHAFTSYMPDGFVSSCQNILSEDLVVSATFENVTGTIFLGILFQKLFTSILFFFIELTSKISIFLGFLWACFLSISAVQLCPRLKGIYWQPVRIIAVVEYSECGADVKQKLASPVHTIYIHSFINHILVHLFI